MIVGFTITSLGTDKQREELYEYLSEITVATDEVRRNIANVGVGVNVYAKNINQEELQNKSFGSRLIEVTRGQAIVISLLSQRLELPLNALESISLEPTGYSYIDPVAIPNFAWAIKEGLVLCISMDSNSNWILNSGFWDDDGEWVDNEHWNDGP